MLGEVFYWIFNMSLIASFMGCLVLLLRQIKAAPRRISAFLWLVPFLRMCVPFGIGSRLSLMSLLARYTTRTVTVWQPADPISFSFMNVMMGANEYFPITYKVQLLEPLFRTAGVIWIIVTLAILLALGILYAATCREIRDARRLEGNVYLSEKVSGPAVYGIIRPRIVLPAVMEGQDLTYILQHERTHIRRADNLWRLLGFFAAALHWFNPLSWIFLKAFLGDLELACDERAAAAYGEAERKAYARTLLACAEQKSVFASAFGGEKVRTRIENVLSYQKMTGLAAASFAVLTAAVIWVMIANAG